MTPKQRHEYLTGKYRELIGIAEEVVECARSALRDTSNARGKDLLSDLAAEELQKEIERVCELGDGVIDQAHRRALEGEEVPSAEKNTGPPGGRPPPVPTERGVRLPAPRSSGVDSQYCFRCYLFECRCQLIFSLVEPVSPRAICR